MGFKIVPDNTIIAATQDAASTYITVESGRPVTIFASGLGVGESVTVTIQAGSGDTWVTCYDVIAGVEVILTSTANIVSIKAPGQYKVSKSTTAAAASVHANS